MPRPGEVRVYNGAFSPEYESHFCLKRKAAEAFEDCERVNFANVKRPHYAPENLVRLIVGSGDDRRTISAHKHVLCRNSLFFEAALEKSWVEGQTNSVNLAGEKPIYVELYVEYCYSGNIKFYDAIRRDEYAPDQDTTIHLWVLADMLQDDGLKRLLNAYLLAVWGNNDVDWEPLVFLATKAPESKLMDLVVDQLLEESRRFGAFQEGELSKLPPLVCQKLLHQALQNVSARPLTDRAQNLASVDPELSYYFHETD